ncbi:MAG TPA: P-loop NTPase [Acidimicrobiia bacterium]|jgi:ATP-binding protein involved in chromosome partitioning|nr:P-loop NTPase [Acidimicrobiia bacterium]
MSTVDLEALRAAIGKVEDPEIHRSLADLNMLRELDVDSSGSVKVLVALTIPGCPLKDRLNQDVTAAAMSVSGVTAVAVEFTHMTDEERAQLVADVRGAPTRQITIGGSGSSTRVIAISSGKGGVGKSSVTANLGVSLARLGKTVGIIDADVWGFSIPKMLGIDRAPTVIDETLLPPEVHGVRVMSMDYFVRPDQAVIWRGPMLHKALEQFLADVHWDDPDYLLIDMPPGTGDIAISMSQFLPRAQAIVVTTPQITAQRVAKRAGLMARKVNQDVMGVIENMSWFTGDDGVRYPIFGEGGGATLAAELEVPLLGQIPLVPALREGADRGQPVTIADPGGEAARAFEDLAAGVEARKPRVRTHPELIVR